MSKDYDHVRSRSIGMTLITGHIQIAVIGIPLIASVLVPNTYERLGTQKRRAP